MTFSRLCSALIALITMYCSGSAQVKEEVGIYLSGALNFHSASFTRLGNVQSCCPEFTSTTGLGTSAGVFYTFPFNDTWRIQARLTYSDRSATLTDTEKSFVADLRDSAKVVEAQFTHELAASLTDIGLEPLLLFRPFGRLDLMLGARFALPITTTFHQTETLTAPEDYGTYLGTGRVYVDTSAVIPDVPSPQISAVIGVRYIINLRTRGVTFLAPEIQYSIPLTQISGGTSWSVAHLRVGLAVGFSSPPRPLAQPKPEPTPSAPPPPAPPTVAAETAPVRAIPSVSIVAKGVTADAREVDNVLVQVEEIAATEIVPVLPHVYFDSASTNWIAPQLASASAFDLDSETMDLETAIHSVPWLLAKRLRENPNAKARLIGTTADTAADKGLTLARDRAQSVMAAFVKRGVKPSALSIEARRFPSKPTIASDETQRLLADAENRRVEIEVTDPSILAPFTQRSIERSVDPPTMKAYVQMANIERARAWSVYVHQGRRRMASFSGSGAVPTFVEWNLADSGIPVSEVPIEVDFVVESATDGQTYLSSDTVAVSQLTIRKKRVERIARREIERFNMLLFEFNDARVSPENARLIGDVRKRITAETEVTIYGLTDELGASEYNRDLSYRRAAEVASILDVVQTRIIGSGEENQKYRSDSPVARGYNRTVVIELVTPVP